LGKWKCIFLALLYLVLFRGIDIAQDLPEAHYYWKATPAGNSAQILTLFCRSCEDPSGTGMDVPLVAVLRDTLGDAGSENARMTDIWLFTYTRPTWEKRVLSGVPFFYWKVGGGSTKVSGEPKPLLNLTTPQHSLVTSSAARIIQLTVLDPLSMPVRATTRAYQTNRMDHERLHLEEAESYLQSAPAADDDSGPTEKELNTVIARLELRKTTLGALVSARKAAEFGQDANLEQERIRARNWELLRQCADKTGLFFEPIDLAGAKGQYAVLWYPIERTTPPQGPALGPVWKLLNLSDPYQQRPRLLKNTQYRRTIDGRVTQVVPLGIYSLTYPKMPLLMIDFRSETHLRRHELTQRAINEITNGVIGVSRFTNWYYFAGADIYDFYASRRGTAMNQQERLNSYSKFRVALALDKTLDPELRAAMQRRVNSLAVNPLESSPNREMQTALQRYVLLQAAAVNEHSQLARRLERDRRSELARFESTTSRQVRDDIFHYVTFSLYTHRANTDEYLASLDAYRQVEYCLNLLDRLTEAGTDPGVAYDTARIKNTVAQLSLLLPEIKQADTREHASQTIEKLRKLSADSDLKAECLAALDVIRSGPAEASEGLGDTETLR